MNRDTPVGFHHDEAQSFGQPCLQSPGIFNGASGNNESHVTILSNDDRTALTSEVVLHSFLNELSSLLQFAIGEGIGGFVHT